MQNMETNLRFRIFQIMRTQFTGSSVIWDIQKKQYNMKIDI